MTITLDASDKAASRASLGANDASNLTTGTVATARLGSGTASSSTFLRGDGSWATAGGAFTKISSGSLSNQVLTVTGLTGDTKIILNCTGNFTGSALIALLSSDGGSSFANSNGDYVWARQQIKLTRSSYTLWASHFFTNRAR